MSDEAIFSGEVEKLELKAGRPEAAGVIRQATKDMLRNLTRGPAISGRTGGHFSLGEVGLDQGRK